MITFNNTHSFRSFKRIFTFVRTPMTVKLSNAFVRYFMEKIENLRVFLNVRYDVRSSRAPRCGGIRYKFYREIIAKHVAINNFFGTHRDGLLFPVTTISLSPVSVFRRCPLAYIGLKSSLTPLPPPTHRLDVLMEDYWSQYPTRWSRR